MNSKKKLLKRQRSRQEDRMYADTDFLLALIQEEDWLTEAAEEVFREHKNDLWTSEYTLVELMMVGYREGMNVVKLVSETVELIEVKGDSEAIEVAALYIEEDGFTPFDALHLVRSGGDRIVSSDKKYDRFTDRIKLEKRVED